MMEAMQNRTLKLLYSYAYEDKTLRDLLEKHLDVLKREYKIIDWYDHNIQAGEDRQNEIDIEIRSADIILLLISSNFLSSEYLYNTEFMKAVERHQAGEAHVIAIILRPVDWRATLVSQLHILPSNKKPITTWTNRDEAFLSVTEGIKNVIQVILSQRMKEEWLNKANNFIQVQQYELAVTAYEQAIHLDPNDAVAHLLRGNMLSRLERYEEAMSDYEEAIRLDPSSIITHQNVDYKLLHNVQSYKDAISACEKFSRRQPKFLDSFPRIARVLGQDRLRRTMKSPRKRLKGS